MCHVLSIRVINQINLNCAFVFDAVFPSDCEFFLVTFNLLPKALNWSDEQPRLVDDGGERDGLGCVVPLIASVTIPLPLSFNLGKLSGTFCAFGRG